ncbi:hypothetical protein [Shimia sp. FJ5]|uniref:hypothetical protein n=1 Tax=Shimia sp. FJ5 TaxID=3079054 RepID=UPI00261D04EC|nr:hypothetical protein [Shimia sp. FJ5]MDV4145505.1 hypothetical protein [Shimia sp. FJ5]
MVDALLQRGWCRFAEDAAVRAWAEAALPAARVAMHDPAQAHWWQCEDTWFVGVDALDNDARGAVAGGPSLCGAPVSVISEMFGSLPALHKAQVSVVREGYPKPRAGESEAAFGYRLRRDAAHVDGIRAEGAARRRRIAEPHMFILGLPLTDAGPEAAPMVLWEGSHEIMRTRLRDALADHKAEDWGQVDITEAYVAARREVFETCERVEVHAVPGESYILHRLTLHGVAPWRAGAGDRIIAYFRPEVATVAEWIEAP